MKKLVVLLIVTFLHLLINSSLNAQSPTINSFSPSKGAVGTLVTIIGTNLENPTVFTIGGVTAIVVSNTGTQLVGLVMPDAVTGTVSVTTAGGTIIGSGNFTVIPTPYPHYQQGKKMLGTGTVGMASQGSSISISSDGNTAIVGGPNDSTNIGAAWVYTRSGGIWTQQGNKLLGTGAVGEARQGVAVSISSDGNTVIVGGSDDNSLAGAAWIYNRSGGVWTQQGNKLVGTGAVGAAKQGIAVSISLDGNTAIVGGSGDDSNAGAAWVYTRSGGVWTQQGNKLVGTGVVGIAGQGRAVSISSDGNTAIVGGSRDSSYVGAAWVYTRSGGVWKQQGNKLVGKGAVGAAYQGYSVSISSDGNTAIVGGYGDNTLIGAAWVYTRSGGIWSQQGNKLLGTGAVGQARQGSAISISSDGNTAIVGGYYDNGSGAAWVYTRSGGVWTQQGNKLIGTGNIGPAWQGWAVSISSDGNTVIVGGYGDNSGAGATWVFTCSSGVWTQQGNKLLGTGAVGLEQQGYAVSVSSDGNTAIVGGYHDNSLAGAAWIYTRSGGVWTQQGPKLVGTVALGAAEQGCAVSISSDGNTAIVGGSGDNSHAGAAWIYTRSGGVWIQQGNKLYGTGAIGPAYQGYSVSISSDGNTAIVGGYYDRHGTGAAWVYTRSGGVWTQQGNKLDGTGVVGEAELGRSVCISSDGNTVIVGGSADNGYVGAAWVYTRSGGVWKQQEKNWLEQGL